MFIENLKRLIKEHGITEYRVAKDLDVHASTVHYWTHGRSEPTIPNIIKIADYFEITTDELLR